MQRMLINPKQGELYMKFFDILCWILLILGGLNWGLVGVANFDVVATIFGAGTPLAHLLYALIGLSAIYAICRWKCMCSGSSCNKM